MKMFVYRYDYDWQLIFCEQIQKLQTLENVSFKTYNMTKQKERTIQTYEH